MEDEFTDKSKANDEAEEKPLKIYLQNFKNASTHIGKKPVSVIDTHLL